MTEAAELVAVVSGKEVGVSALLSKVEAGLRKTDAQVNKTSQGFSGGLSRAQQKASGDALSLAQSYARLDSAMGRPAAGADRLRQALANAEFASIKQANAIQIQIAQLDRLASAGARGASGFDKIVSGAKAAGQAFGALGIALGAQQLVAFGVDAGREAVALSRTEAALKQLAGSQAAYTNVLAIARQQQQLFGGSLNDNLSDLSSFVVQAKSSGAQLSTLVDLSQRLATFDPGQGIKGAAAAMRELLSGNPRALAARFELPASALAGISDQTKTVTERLAILDGVLNKAGITSELVQGSVSAEAKAYNDLGTAIDNAKTKLGAFLAQKAAAPAQAISGLLNIGAGQETNNTQATAIQGLVNQYLQLQAGQRVVTQGEKDFAAAMLERLGVQTDAQRASERQATIDASYQAGLASLAQAWDRGGLTAAQYNAAVAELAATKERALNAASGLTEATTTETQANTQASQAAQQVAAAYAEEIVKKQESAQAATLLAQFQQDIANLAGPVSSGIISNAGAAELLASKYNLASAEARVLISLQAAIAGGQARLAQQARATTNLVPGGVAGNAPGKTGKGDADILATVNAATRENEAAAKAAADEQRRYQEAVGGSSTVLKNLRADLKGVTVNSADYFRILRQIRDEETKSTKGAGGGGASAKAAAARANRQLAENEKIENQEQEHQNKLTEITEQGEQARRQAEQRAYQAQLDGRASFYERLGEIKDPKVQQALSAQFEQAALAAKAVAERLGPEAGQAYMDAAVAAIEADSRLDQAIAEAEKGKDKGRAEYLRGVKALQQAAEAEKLRAITEGADKQAAIDAKKLAEEEARHNKQLEALRLKKIAAGQLPADGSIGNPPETTATGAIAGQPNAVQPVVDESAAVAADASAQTIAAAVAAMQEAIKAAIDGQTAAVVSALKSLKSSGTFVNK